jgi:hypothetical protein
MEKKAKFAQHAQITALHSQLVWNGKTPDLNTKKQNKKNLNSVIERMG